MLVKAALLPDLVLLPARKIFASLDMRSVPRSSQARARLKPPRQRHPSTFVLSLNIRALLQQQPYHSLLPVHSCHVQCRLFIEVVRLDVRSLLQQQPHHGLVFVHSCHVQRYPFIGVLDLEVRTLLQKQSYHNLVPTSSRSKERRVSEVSRHALYIRTILQQQPHHSLLPFSAAACSAVTPSKPVMASTSAPLFKSSRTTASYPH